MSLNRIKLVVAILALVGLAAACDEPRTLMTESRTVALEGADRAEVSLQMGAGELKVRAADQEPLLEGSFEFSRERYRPEVDYSVFAEKGRLQVRQPRRRGIQFGSRRNEWDLRLSRAVPLELDIDLGAGRNELDLRGLKIDRLDIDMGVGEVLLDLGGPHERSFNVKIDGGIGSAKIRFPSEVGVRVRVDGGLGSVDAHGLTKTGGAYVNEAYGKSAVTIEVDIDAGIGSLDLRCDPSSETKI